MLMDIQKNEKNASNTLDLNNPTTKPQSDPITIHTSRVAPVKPPSKKKKWVLLSLGAIMLIAVIGFFSYRYYQQRLTEDNLKNSKIVIGDTTITQDDISKYANALDENKKENPGVYYDSGSREIAINDLVTNAGLKEEAKKQNASLTAEEYQKLFELPVGITDATPYLNQIKSFNDFSYVAVTQKENEALKAKLKDNIISSKKFLVSQITFDSPFFTQQQDVAVANGLHTEAKAKLNNDFLPLFKSKAKPEAMGAISDVNQVDPTKPDTNNAEQYFKKMVTTSLFIDEYYGQEGFFNDVETDQYGVVKVEDLKYTPPEFDRLKNVGEYTEMFTSRTGNYMIVRLEDKAERQYDTWDQFTKSYVDKYVPKKMMSLQQASKIVSDILYETKEQLDLKHLGATKASAVADCSNNHLVGINLQAKVYETNSNVIHGYLNVPYSWSSTGQCPTRSGTGTTPSTFRINCYNGRPTITVTQQPDPSRFRVRGFGIEGNGEWNYANVNAFVGSSVDWFLTYELIPQNPQYTVTSTLSRSTGGGFGNSVVPDGTHGICQVNTVYCAWGAGDSVSLGGLTAAANVSAPATITTANGDVWTRRASSPRRVGPGAQGSTIAVNWIYDPPSGPIQATCQNIGASISASPSSISSGGSSTISWTGGTATSATSNFGNVNTSGSRTVSPTSTTTYTITWTAPTGSASCSTTVAVDSTPPDLCLDIEGIQPPFPPGREPDGTGNCPLTYYPWFQTQKGDVTSLDIIQGQNIAQGDPSNPPLGAKHAASNGKYNPAEAYGVIAYGDLSASASRKSGNFCSQNLYILGENLANRQNCSSSYLEGASWGRYISNPVSVDEIKNSLNITWENNGKGNAGSCSPYKTTLISTNPVVLQADISSACPGGNLMKTGSPDQATNLNSIAGLTGRGTLWVAGDLNINSNIEYSNAVATIANLPNLAIFVEGDIVIDPSVTRIDAMLISGGKIDTCKDSGDKSANKCEKQLTINGAISSLGSRIDLSRRHYSPNDPNANPAELVILTPQSIIMPPPGLSIVGNESGGELQINKLELPPRL